jgi:hypothetical protein
MEFRLIILGHLKDVISHMLQKPIKKTGDSMPDLVYNE